MRKIVVPTDFSSNAFNALKYAVELFKYEKSEFFILHAFADEVYNNAEIITPFHLEEVKENLQAKYEESLKDFLAQIKKDSPNPRHNFSTLASFGALVDEVSSLVNQENADIVIMGTRGKTNDNLLTFGSNTLHVIKYIPCPVLSIPENYKFKELSNLLFPTNFMIPYQRRELKLVAEIARAFNTAVHMLYISRFPIDSLRQQGNQQFLKEQFKGTTYNYHRVEEEDRINAIITQIDHLKIDLLVMVNSRYTYLENILSQSTIDKISLHPRVPFLVLQNFHRDNS